MKFSIKDFLSKCDQICSFQRILSDWLKKFLLENFIFCAFFHIWPNVLLNLRDFFIEVTFFHIVIFLNFVVMLSKMHPAISFYANVFKCLPEKYFADTVGLSFVGQLYSLEILKIIETRTLTHFSPMSHFYTQRKRFSDIFRGHRNVTLD